MNQDWHDFLTSTNTAIFSGQKTAWPPGKKQYANKRYAIADLAVLTVSGRDAAQFLQGQTTCNIHDVSETQSRFGAFCTPKGRTISTFLISKRRQSFLLVLPEELLPIVKKKLQLYVLRSDVQLIGGSDDYCLFGCSRATPETANIPFPEGPLAALPVDAGTTVALPAVNGLSRCLTLLPAKTAMETWQNHATQGLQTGNSSEWRTLDIHSGIPWLNLLTTEQFIPQMLNLDQLGGISLDKGCYTGQEIVARTHYLGKAKRKMYLARCQGTEPPETGSAITALEDASDQAVGSVITVQETTTGFIMLVVLQIAHAQASTLVLANRNRDHLTVTELVYSIGSSV